MNRKQKLAAFALLQAAIPSFRMCPDSPSEVIAGAVVTVGDDVVHVTVFIDDEMPMAHWYGASRPLRQSVFSHNVNTSHGCKATTYADDYQTLAGELAAIAACGPRIFAERAP